MANHAVQTAILVLLCLAPFGAVPVPAASVTQSESTIDTANLTESRGFLLDASETQQTWPGGLIVNGTSANILVENIPTLAVGDLTLFDPDGLSVISGAPVEARTLLVLENVEFGKEGWWNLKDALRTALTSFYVNRVADGEALNNETYAVNVRHTLIDYLKDIFGAQYPVDHRVAGHIAVNFAPNPDTVTCYPQSITWDIEAPAVVVTVGITAVFNDYQIGRNYVGQVYVYDAGYPGYPVGTDVWTAWETGNLNAISLLQEGHTYKVVFFASTFNIGSTEYGGHCEPTTSTITVV